MYTLTTLATALVLSLSTPIYARPLNTYVLPPGAEIVRDAEAAGINTTSIGLDHYSQKLYFLMRVADVISQVHVHGNMKSSNDSLKHVDELCDALSREHREFMAVLIEHESWRIQNATTNMTATTKTVTTTEAEIDRTNDQNFKDCVQFYHKGMAHAHKLSQLLKAAQEEAQAISADQVDAPVRALCAAGKVWNVNAAKCVVDRSSIKGKGAKVKRILGHGLSRLEWNWFHIAVCSAWSAFCDTDYADGD